MSEQKGLKKNRSAEDNALIRGIISFGLIGLITLLVIIREIMEKWTKIMNDNILGLSFTIILMILAITWIVSVPFSFFSGLVTLIKSIRNKSTFRSYLKSSIGILTMIPLLLALAIAIPNFLKFSARAKQSEPKQNLGAIYDKYQQYHRRYHTYPSLPSIQLGSTVLDCLSVASWSPRNSYSAIRYNYNCMNTEVFSPGTYTRDYPCPPGIVTSATKDSFTVAACGNIDNDATVDVWTIDDAKHLKNVIDDVKE